MESERDVIRSLEEECRTQTAGYRKTRGFATTSGQDYEVALCSLIFLRALRSTSDFFLASNHDLYDKFDDVVLFYKLHGDQGREYRAILLQAKHGDKYTEKKLTSIYPFTLEMYLESFKKIKSHCEQTVKVEHCEINFKEIILVLYTNRGCSIGDAAVDVTANPEVRLLKDFLNTGGRLLRVPEAQRVGLSQGPDTADFLRDLLLCTEQTSVKTVDEYLEEELCEVLKVKSPEIVNKLSSEFKRVVKAWWSEDGTGRYLTAESEEWNKVLEMQITFLNSDTLIIDRQLNLDFTSAVFEGLHRHMKMNWISVRDKYQATVTRSRLFRAQKNSLVLDTKVLEGRWDEVEVLWGKSVCPTLVLDMTKYSQREDSLLLRRLEEAIQSDARRHLVIIAKEEPANVLWNVVEPLATWFVLDTATRGRLLSGNVELQGNAVVLRDIVGSDVSEVMTDEVINSLALCETAIKLGEAMPEPLEYYVPRCLQRITSQKVNFDLLRNKNILFFLGNVFSIAKFTFSKIVKTLWKSDLNLRDKIEGQIFVPAINSHSEIRVLCSRFSVRGMSGEIGSKGFTGDVTEFIPFTWICEEKVVVVEGLPGVGKSSFVTAMCYSVKKKFPEAWVLRVDMGRHSDYIKGRHFRDTSDIIDFLLRGHSKDLHSLERKLLEYLLTVTGNIFLFLDAFDEVSPDFTATCCDLLKGIAHNVRFRQMVVTTRPVTTRDVQEALETEAFSLPVFSEEEQTLFLQQFSVARRINVGKEEVAFLRQSAGPVIEIPLLCKMAAEVLLQRQDQSLLKCVDPWRRVLLYQLFVEHNIKTRLAEKLGLQVYLPTLRSLLDSNKKQHQQNLQGLAVRKLMPSRNLSSLYVSSEIPEEKLGLVVNKGDTVDFQHQTFAEYFLGRFLSEQWRQCPRQLLHDVLTQDGSELVAATLSWSLFEDFPLHMAVARGDEVAVRALLSSAGTTDRGGRSSLHVAAMTQGKNREVWELLVASGEDLNREDDVLGRSAVKYAEESSNWDFIDLMQANGASLGDLKFVTDLNQANEVLIYTINKDLTSLCQYILNLHKGIFEETFDADGNTLLHIAAANNSVGVMKNLEEMHRVVNFHNIQGRTPLQQASIHGHLEAVRLLVENGADPNIKNNYGSTALTSAAGEGRLQVVNFLIENGADLNVSNIHGATALTMAARGGHVDVVKLLMENGVDPNICNEFGETAFTLAASDGHLEVVRLLIENGADPNMKNENGETALTLASCEGYLDVVRLLIENGADPNIKNDYGGTTLVIATCFDHLEVVKILLENGGDPNIENADGHTALMFAAYKGDLEAVKLLIQNGADPNLKTESGETALMDAALEGHVTIVEYLLTKGADPNVTNAEGKTVFQICPSESCDDL